MRHKRTIEDYSKYWLKLDPSRVRTLLQVEELLLQLDQKYQEARIKTNATNRDSDVFNWRLVMNKLDEQRRYLTALKKDREFQSQLCGNVYSPLVIVLCQ